MDNLSVVNSMNVSNETLVNLYQNGDKKALEQLITNNMGIVYKVANKYKGILASKKLEYDELINEGVIGIIVAAKYYNETIKNKAKFIGYAIRCINSEMLGFLNGRSEKEIENNKLYHSATSIYAPIGDEEDNELIDTIKDCDNNYESIEDKIFLEQIKAELDETMLNSLSGTQIRVLKLKYGWDYEPMTLDGIGKIIYKSKERVRQIEAKSLRDLRKNKWTLTYGKQYYKELTGVDLDYRYNSKLGSDSIKELMRHKD